MAGEFAEFIAAAEKHDPEGFGKARAEKADRDAMRRDALRYRELRRGQHWSVINGIGDVLRAEDLDASVDAQM